MEAAHTIDPFTSKTTTTSEPSTRTPTSQGSVLVEHVSLSTDEYMLDYFISEEGMNEFFGNSGTETTTTTTTTDSFNPLPFIMPSPAQVVGGGGERASECPLVLGQQRVLPPHRRHHHQEQSQYDTGEKVLIPPPPPPPPPPPRALALVVNNDETTQVSVSDHSTTAGNTASTSGTTTTTTTTTIDKKPKGDERDGKQEEDDDNHDNDTNNQEKKEEEEQNNNLQFILNLTDEDAVINHNNRRTKLGNIRWITIRGKRRQVSLEEVQRLIHIFENYKEEEKEEHLEGCDDNENDNENDDNAPKKHHYLHHLNNKSTKPRVLYQEGRRGSYKYRYATFLEIRRNIYNHRGASVTSSSSTSSSSSLCPSSSYSMSSSSPSPPAPSKRKQLLPSPYNNNCNNQTKMLFEERNKREVKNPSIKFPSDGRQDQNQDRPVSEEKENHPRKRQKVKKVTTSSVGDAIRPSLSSTNTTTAATTTITTSHKDGAPVVATSVTAAEVTPLLPGTGGTRALTSSSSLPSSSSSDVLMPNGSVPPSSSSTPRTNNITKYKENLERLQQMKGFIPFDADQVNEFLTLLTALQQVPYLVDSSSSSSSSSCSNHPPPYGSNRTVVGEVGYQGILSTVEHMWELFCSQNNMLSGSDNGNNDNNTENNNSHPGNASAGGPQNRSSSLFPAPPSTSSPGGPQSNDSQGGGSSGNYKQNHSNTTAPCDADNCSLNNQTLDFSGLPLEPPSASSLPEKEDAEEEAANEEDADTSSFAQVAVPRPMGKSLYRQDVQGGDDDIGTEATSPVDSTTSPEEADDEATLGSTGSQDSDDPKEEKYVVQGDDSGTEHAPNDDTLRHKLTPDHQVQPSIDLDYDAESENDSESESDGDEKTIPIVKSRLTGGDNGFVKDKVARPRTNAPQDDSPHLWDGKDASPRLSSSVPTMILTHGSGCDSSLSHEWSDTQESVVEEEEEEESIKDRSPRESDGPRLTSHITNNETYAFSDYGSWNGRPPITQQGGNRKENSVRKNLGREMYVSPNHGTVLQNNQEGNLNYEEVQFIKSIRNKPSSMTRDDDEGSCFDDDWSPPGTMEMYLLDNKTLHTILSSFETSVTITNEDFCIRTTLQELLAIKESSINHLTHTHTHNNNNKSTGGGGGGRFCKTLVYATHYPYCRGRSTSDALLVESSDDEDYEPVEEEDRNWASTISVGTSDNLSLC